LYKRRLLKDAVFLDYLSEKVGGIIPHPEKMGKQLLVSNQ